MSAPGAAARHSCRAGSRADCRAFATDNAADNTSDYPTTSRTPTYCTSRSVFFLRALFFLNGGLQRLEIRFLQLIFWRVHNHGGIDLLRLEGDCFRPRPGYGTDV